MQNEYEKLADLLKNNDESSKSSRINAYLKEIEYLLKNGTGKSPITTKTLVKKLNENGFCIKQKTFEIYLYRARKKNKSVDNMPIVSISTDNKSKNVKHSENINNQDSINSESSLSLEERAKKYSTQKPLLKNRENQETSEIKTEETQVLSIREKTKNNEEIAKQFVNKPITPPLFKKLLNKSSESKTEEGIKTEETPKQNYQPPVRRKTLKEISAEVDKMLAENKRPLY